jgi:hypothetical protein
MPALLAAYGIPLVMTIMGSRPDKLGNKQRTNENPSWRSARAQLPVTGSGAATGRCAAFLVAFTGKSAIHWQARIVLVFHVLLVVILMFRIYGSSCLPDRPLALQLAVALTLSGVRVLQQVIHSIMPVFV